MAMRNQQDLYSHFQTPGFQQAWAGGRRSAGELGLSDDEYNWFKSTGFQPYEPNAGTNVQQIDGVWKNTMVQPGQTQKQFQPVTSAPTGAPTNTAYSNSILGTLAGLQPKAQTPSPAAPASTTNNSLARLWNQARAASSAATTTGRAGQLAQIRGAPPTSQPQTAGAYDPFRDGSMASLPSGTTGLPASAPPDRSVRDNAYPAGQTNRGPQLAAVQNFVPPSTPAAGGMTEAHDTQALMNGAAYANGGRPAPGQTVGGPNARVPEIWDYKASPEYQWRLSQAEKALNQELMGRGRYNSSYGVDRAAKLASDIGAEEVDKQYGRALNANLLNYGRDVSEDNQAYNRFWNEDNTSFSRNALIAQLGQRAAELASGQSIGQANANVGADQNYSNQLLQLLLGYGNAQAGNQWQGVNPMIDLMTQGGQNNASMWSNLGALPANIIRLLLQTKSQTALPGEVPSGATW